MKVYQYRGTVSGERDAIAIRDALGLALQFAGYNEDDEQEPEAFVHDDGDGKWVVSRDDRAQDPTSSEQLAGPFSTEEEARKACDEINTKNTPQPNEIEVDLPNGAEIHDSRCERGRSGSYHASVTVKLGNRWYEGTSHCGSHFVRGSVDAEWGAAREALDDVIAKVKAGEYVGKEDEELEVA